MAFDPKEPRDKGGKWSTGGASNKLTSISGGKASGHNAGGGNRTIAKQIAKQHTDKELGIVGSNISSKAERGVNPKVLQEGKPIDKAEQFRRTMVARQAYFKSLKTLSKRSDSEYHGKSDVELRKIVEKSYPDVFWKK